MPQEEILRICFTVAIAQLMCSCAANWLVFGRKSYRSAVDRLDLATKAKDRGDSHQAKGHNVEKRAKRAKKVEDDYRAAATMVAGFHFVPNVLTSIVFFILLRIFGTEMKGVIGILPFTPFSILRRITGRGLDFSDAAALFEATSPKVTDVEQACSFIFVYGLSTLSIKFYVNKLFGTPAPPGVESLANILDKTVGAADADAEPSKSKQPTKSKRL